LEYEWDLVGNLKKRRDVNQSGLTEEFFYDDLYRLTSSSLSTTGTNMTMTYDARGNIASKSGVGNYTYHATNKHQLVSTSNGWNFGYDANGNMTSGRGPTTTSWTSYDYPACISTGASCAGASNLYSQFEYTPDRRYWRQYSRYANGEAVTVYVGGLLEKVSTSAGRDYRNYIRAGNTTVIVSFKTSGTSVAYISGDHIASNTLVTDSSGLSQFVGSYEAFGRRRGSNWSGAPTAADWAAIASYSRRGYTDHTMLDNLELTHMNGRAYDPVIGRFLSADPFVPDPLSTQSYNRYSYVQNNPLTFIDPSGFDDTVPRWTPSWTNWTTPWMWPNFPTYLEQLREHYAAEANCSGKCNAMRSNAMWGRKRAR
jgi:RHS repeat-associated protein